MSKSTISTFQLFEMFPDQESARKYLESRLWPEGPKCPVCGLGERITERKGGFYRCNQCKEDFTVRTGTIFERSHVPLHNWIYAMYLLVTARKGISSLQLSKQIGITQKSAWFVLHRLREACGDELTKLQGIVEIDETYVGGIEANKHESKKLKAGRGTVGKAPVLTVGHIGCISRQRTLGKAMYAYDFGKRKDPCGDCWDGHCTMNCGPAICVVCGQPLTWKHDHRADLSGLDDGPPLHPQRKRPPPKSGDELRDIRARAWATRRQKYGQHGHR